MAMIATLFDFDGVLVDTEPVHLAAFRDVLAPFGVTVSDSAYLEKYFGFDDKGAFRAMLHDAGRRPDDDEIARLVEAKKPAFMARIVSELRVFPGAADLVRRRAARGVVGIVSGALDHEIRFCLERMNVATSVSFIVAAERCSACKPDPEGYLLAIAELARLSTNSSKPVVLEDSIAGVEAAKRAGLRCVGVAHSYEAALLTAAGADIVVRDLLSLTDALFDDGVA